MDPRYYSVDVHIAGRSQPVETMLVIVDWWPTAAESTRRQLNAQLRAVAAVNRAVGSDLREYTLRAFDVAHDGQRIDMVPSWTWRYHPTVAELDGDGWWRL